MGILKCSHLFTDNMVLQRGKNIKVWGMAKDGTKVNVGIDGRVGTADTINHEWMVTLPPMKAGGPYILKVWDDNGENLQFVNVMIGEVWLAGGQSNMELELKDSLNGKETLKNIKDANVRYFYVKKNSYIDEFFYQDEANNCWMEADENSAASWSAVGFYFAKKISEATDVAVGIIGCNWGGTSASNWMSKQMLESDTNTKEYLKDYEKATEGKTFEQHLKELEEYKLWQKDWQPRMDAFYISNPEATWEEAQENVGICKWPGPMGPTHEYRPFGLYETMLKRVIPYSLAGFIYYQGESDDHRPEMYDKLLRNLITQWRNDWEDNKLPFICVQLPMHINRGAKDTKNWCLLREAQMKVHQTVAGTGIAVAIDLGEYNNIHPIDKKPVGDRLALQALHHFYKLIPGEEAYGPLYESCEYYSDGILLKFQYADEGFLVKEEKLEGFEIAGVDKNYYKAEAKVEAGQIFISSPEVTNPKYARYLWTNYSNVYIYGKNGLPLAPFRTSVRDI
ncbi:MAG: Sialate O-acetylesterase [Anaerocolumna sp.]|jgi:sialate O-acetylesterase|nr:Sialate O-acetylesterase [Anaerocolumna sp.]